jgi:hypothetical protein
VSLSAVDLAPSGAQTAEITENQARGGMAPRMQFCASGETVKHPPSTRSDWDTYRGAPRQTSPDSVTMFVSRPPSLGAPVGPAAPAAPPPPSLRAVSGSWTPRGWAVSSPDDTFRASASDGRAATSGTASGPALLLVGAAAFLAAAIALLFLRADGAADVAARAARASAAAQVAAVMPAAAPIAVAPPASPAPAAPVALDELALERAAEAIATAEPTAERPAPKASPAPKERKSPAASAPRAARARVSPAPKVAAEAPKVAAAPGTKSLEARLAELHEEQLRR